MSTTRLAEYRHFIAGEWSDAGEGKTFDDIDPYSGDVVARVARGGQKQLGRGAPSCRSPFRATAPSGRAHQHPTP